jgi:hypothetical protein
MATAAELEHVLGKAILDGDFRQKLLANPQEAAKGIGIGLADAQVAAIRNLDPDLAEWWARGFLIARGKTQGFLW